MMTERTSTAPEVNGVDGEAGFVMVEMSGGILLYLIMMAAAAILLYSLFSNSKLAETQQGVLSMRMQIQQLYTGATDYSGLDNALAVKAGVVPKRFQRGTSVVTPWGGDITLGAGSDPGTFTITLTQIPQEACTKLATFQAESWSTISVNGGAVAQGTSVASAAQSCNSANTIIYASR